MWDTIQYPTRIEFWDTLYNIHQDIFWDNLCMPTSLKLQRKLTRQETTFGA